MYLYFIARFFVSPSNCHVKNLDVCYSVRVSDEEESKDTTTPLIEAAVSHSVKVVTDLLKHGASVNFPKVINITDVYDDDSCPTGVTEIKFRQPWSKRNLIQ